MRKVDFLILFFIIIVSVISLKDLFKPGFYTSHDGMHQVVRLYYFDQALRDGQIPPRWAGGLQNGFGYPLFIFSYHLPWIIAEPLHLLGLSIFDSIKMTLLIGFIVSGITMYVFQREMFGRLPALIGSFLYLFAPYRFSNIFVRAAVGDATSFIFPPLLFLAFYKLRKTNRFDWKWIVLASVSFAGLLLSHAMIFFFYVIAFVFYLFFFFPFHRNKRLFITEILIVAVLSIGLTSYYFFPSVFEREFTNFTAVMKPIFVNSQPYITLKDLIYSPWGYGLLDAKIGRMSFQLGITQWLVVIGSFLLLLRFGLIKKKNDIKKREYMEFLFYFLAFIISILLMLSVGMSFWKMLMDIAIIDFTWRMLALTVFFTSVLAGFFIHNSRYKILLSFFLILLALYANRNHIRINQTLKWPLQLYLDTEFTTNTYNEYRPKWVWPSYLDKKRPRVEYNAPALIDIQSEKSNYLKVEIDAKEKGEVSINTIYYPGWHVLVDGKDISIAANKIGIMEFPLSKGQYTIEARFTETPLRNFSNLVSLGTIGIIILGFYKYRKFND